MNGWQRYFDNPAETELYVMHTGSVHMRGNIHFNRQSPEFKSLPGDTRYNPVLAYLLKHPDKGLVLMDTGLHGCFCEKPHGNFGPLLGRVVKARAGKGMDVASRLQSMGLSPSDVSLVILSHLHLDHTSGLPYFEGTRVYADAAELKAAGSPLAFADGYVRAHCRGVEIRPIEYGDPVPPFDRVCDFFGDGSLFIVGAEGHTRGSVAAILNAKGGPLLLTFDAAHRAANLEMLVPPRGDYAAARRSLERIRAFLEDFPQARVFYGHDPDQLGGLRLMPDFYS